MRQQKTKTVQSCTEIGPIGETDAADGTLKTATPTGPTAYLLNKKLVQAALMWLKKQSDECNDIDHETVHSRMNKLEDQKLIEDGNSNAKEFHIIKDVTG